MLGHNHNRTFHFGNYLIRFTPQVALSHRSISFGPHDNKIDPSILYLVSNNFYQRAFFLYSENFMSWVANQQLVMFDFLLQYFSNGSWFFGSQCTLQSFLLAFLQCGIW